MPSIEENIRTVLEAPEEVEEALEGANKEVFRMVRGNTSQGGAQ